MSNDPNQLIQKLAAEGNSSGAFTKEEKLALVAAGAMAPEEVGLASAEDAQLALQPEAEKEVKFGDAVEFAASVVPLALRAQWALDETHIILAGTDKDDWLEKWIAEHKNDFMIQGQMHCGTALARFQRNYKDPILGLAQMLHLCGEMLEKKYLGEEVPPSTEPKNRET